jgi:hypothetical protein
MRLAGGGGKARYGLARRGPFLRSDPVIRPASFLRTMFRAGSNRTAAKSRYLHKKWIPIFSTPPMWLAAGASHRKSVRP